MPPCGYGWISAQRQSRNGFFHWPSKDSSMLHARMVLLSMVINPRTPQVCVSKLPSPPPIFGYCFLYIYIILDRQFKVCYYSCICYSSPQLAVDGQVDKWQTCEGQMTLVVMCTGAVLFIECVSSFFNKLLAM